MTTLRIVFVHGISNAILNNNYAIDLQTHLVDKLKAHGVIPPKTADSDISRYVTFHPINYSSIGQKEEDQVLQAYFKERDKLYNFLDKVIEKAGFDSLRQLLISSVSDVLVYESDHWRDEIRKLLLEAINPFIKTNDPVTVIGHSLGSVVAFDTLYYHSRHEKSWLEANFKATNLFTLGSPIALFSMELTDDTGQQKPRYYPAGETPPNMDPANTNPDLEPVKAEGVWYNFLDAQDLIAYPLEVLFKDKFKVEDILVQTGTNPVTAHSEYWKNQEVAGRIAERLAIDYKRVSGLK